MWTPEHRCAADRRGLGYPSDLTDAWALVEPMIRPAKRDGRRREVNLREVPNGIFYLLSIGCQWAALPKDLPPKSTAGQKQAGQNPDNTPLIEAIGKSLWA